MSSLYLFDRINLSLISYAKNMFFKNFQMFFFNFFLYSLFVFGILDLKQHKYLSGIFFYFSKILRFLWFLGW